MNFAEDVAEKQWGVDPQILNKELEKFKEKYKLTEKDIESLPAEETAKNFEEF